MATGRILDSECDDISSESSSRRSPCRPEFKVVNGSGIWLAAYSALAGTGLVHIV